MLGWSCGIATALVAVLTAAASAQQYPSRAVRIVVPFAAAGTGDFVARIVADKLAGALARSRTDASGGVVLLTSRVSVEMVQKTAAIGAPFFLAILLRQRSVATL